MWKRLISSALAGVMLFTSLGAGAATGRISTNVPANWRYGGSPHVSGADKQCATSAPAVATVIAKAEACVKSYILSHDSPGASSRFIGEGAVQMNGTQGRMKDFTVAVGQNQTGHKVLMYFWGDCGAEQGATMNPGGTACTRRETTNECIKRQMVGADVQKKLDQESCTSQAAAETKVRSENMAKARGYGAASLASMQWMITQILNRIGSFTVQGKVISSAAQLTLATVTQLGWQAYVTAADATWTKLIDKHKSDCDAKALRDYNARQAAITLDCNAP